MGILGRLLRRNHHDPYWKRFITGPLADPVNEIGPALRSAHEGAVFPTQSPLPAPSRLTSDLGELAQFLGATSLGVLSTDASRRGSQLASDDQEGHSTVTDYPFTIICTVPAEYDPRESPGIGGQHSLREAASISFSLAAYIRELGYRATVQPRDSDRLAAEAGLGEIGRNGRLVSPEHGTKVYVGDVVLTDVPLAAGVVRG